MSVKTQTNEIIDRFSAAATSNGAFKIHGSYQTTYDQGVYGCLITSPSRRTQRALGVDREVLAVVSTFENQQTRTIRFVKHEISESLGRYESSIAIVIHSDPHGNEKLKNWGKEDGISILPVQARRLAVEERGDLLNILCTELYSHDPFDITGPVSDDHNFFGRREEAIELARKLRNGQIRSCLGIRKVGKTSIINRVLREIKRSHDCISIMVDCSGDGIWSMTAAQLLSSMANAVDYATSSNDYSTVVSSKQQPSITDAVQALEARILRCNKPLIFIFDEVDYITPGSPTAKGWKVEFNIFWRNLRRIFQECDRLGNTASILVSGVSSYWFTVESIEGIENAALSFIPEEYLNPMPLGATTAMLRRLSTTAGLIFTPVALEAIAKSSGNMPYWARKCCSYINRQIPVNGRPREIAEDVVLPLIDDFVSKEGVAIAEIALNHLFRVHPLLQEAVSKCYDGHIDEVAAVLKSVLFQYGILTFSHQISGSMMSRAFESLRKASAESQVDARPEDGVQWVSSRPDLTEWAEELATIGKRRNILERKLRAIVLNFLRLDTLRKRDGRPVRERVKDRVLRRLPTAQRDRFHHLSAEDTLARFTWKQLTELMEGEWALFDPVFNDRKMFSDYCDIVNDRPDTHAKATDQADIALYRRALSWLEEKLAKIE